MSAGLADFFRYNLWANQTLLDFCEPLTDTQLNMTTVGVYGSVRAILMHLFSSEESYAGRVGGQAPGPRLMESDAFPGFGELRRRAEQSGQALIAFAEKATEADLTHILHLDDGTYDAPVYIVLIQAINHGIDHRSQIATVLSQQGIELPDLAAWGYNDAVVTPQNVE
ncbi:MAG TPA: DinB family protein [Ktedonobacterales bacterium]|jgi:uncharacterized damage-inducible protein DinB|nr:DinB family protein [Ktedonobacterales bacterium]